MTERQPYPTRTILLPSELQRQTALTLLANAPLDPERPLEFVLRERPKARRPDQNALMWAGPLRDIAEQAYVNGRTYTAEVWHEHMKREFLPEDFDPVLCKQGYRKWDMNPRGERVLVGSTTELTVRGFALYLHEVEAYAQTELGVQFSERPNTGRGAS